jgi:hypothetical protein
MQIGQCIYSRKCNHIQVLILSHCCVQRDQMKRDGGELQWKREKGGDLSHREYFINISKKVCL